MNDQAIHCFCEIEISKSVFLTYTTAGQKIISKIFIFELYMTTIVEEPGVARVTVEVPGVCQYWQYMPDSVKFRVIRKWLQ